MKLSFSAATFGAVLISGTALSRSQSLLFAKAASVSKEDQTAENNFLWEQKFLRLKQKLKVKSNLRMKLALREGYLMKSGDECHPEFGMGEFATDVGILACRNQEQICVPDPLSQHGGICAELVPVRKDMITIDQENAIARSIEQVKPFIVKDKLKAMHLSGGGMEGCTPLHLTDGGSFVTCQSSGHVCVKDSSSSLGGTCVDITPHVHYVGSPLPHFEHGSHRNLNACRYLNGTSGVKCSGPQACYGLSPSFIRSNIGCGSCNSYAACMGLSGESKIRLYHVCHEPLHE